MRTGWKPVVWNSARSSSAATLKVIEIAGARVTVERRLGQNGAQDLLRLREVAFELGGNADPPARPQHAAEGEQRAGLLGQPVEHRVQHDDIEAVVGQAVEVVGVADLEGEVVARAAGGQADAQRKRIDAQHPALIADQLGDMAGQQAGAAADVEHALARADSEIGDQALARLELAGGADPLVVERKGRVVEGERRRPLDRSATHVHGQHHDPLRARRDSPV